MNQGKGNLGLDSDTVLVSIHFVTEITSKQLHEQTAAMLDRAKSGQRMRVLRNGKPDALLVPADEAIDPSWNEIMTEVWAMAKERRGKGIPPRPNPVLEERKRRQKVILKNHARLR
jgi:antitoxin (DNA-binding transcriptional repressor) of toxin-antitoxin stability system